MGMTNRLCFKCYCEGKKEKVGIDHFMYAIEIPYMNLFFHRDCYRLVKSVVEEFVKENEKNMLKYREL